MKRMNPQTSLAIANLERELASPPKGLTSDQVDARATYILSRMFAIELSDSLHGGVCASR